MNFLGVKFKVQRLIRYQGYSDPFSTHISTNLAANAKNYERNPSNVLHMELTVLYGSTTPKKQLSQILSSCLYGYGPLIE